MNKDLRVIIEIAALTASLAIAGCSSDTKATPSGSAEAGCPGKDAGCPGTDAGCPGTDAGCPGPTPETPGDANTPPTGKADAIDSWIAKGDYKAWKCEPSAHDARSPSPHGKNRICSNPKASAHGAGEYPVGAASVKELYDAAGTNITGYAVGLHFAAGAGGETWYWYEELGASIVANGLGSTGTPKNVCVGCHMGAGSDPMHSGHDMVYTQVK